MHAHRHNNNNVKPCDSATVCALRLLCRANRNIRVTRSADLPATLPPRVDRVDLAVLVERLRLFARCSDAVMAGAFCLLRRLDMSDARLPVTDGTVRPILIACILLSRKLVEDGTLSNHHLRDVVGVSERELVALEDWLLHALDFQAHLSGVAIATAEGQLAEIRQAAASLSVDSLRVKGVPLTFATLAAAAEGLHTPAHEAREDRHEVARGGADHSRWRLSPKRLFFHNHNHNNHDKPNRSDSLVLQHAIPVAIFC